MAHSRTLGILVAGGLLAASAAQAQQELKFAVFTPSKEYSFVSTMQPFADRVNAEAGGTIKIVTYPDGALSRDPVGQIKLVQDGVVDIAWVIPGYTPGRFPDNDVFELPGVVKDAKEASIVAWRLLEKNMLRGYEEFTMIGLVITPLSNMHTAKPLKSIDDLKGLKIRGGTSIANQIISGLGATPVGMPITQAPENISRGVLDGITTHLPGLYQFRVSDVAPHHYMMELGTAVLAIMMNKKKFESLPPQAQAAIMKNRGEQLSVAFGNASLGQVNEYLALAKADPKHTVTVPSAAEADKIKARMRPVVDDWANKDPRNKALLAALEKEVAAVRATN